MSYSFNVRAANKEAAFDAVEAKLDAVVESQPIHNHDQQIVLDTVLSVLTLLGAAPEGLEYAVSVHGSCWQRDGVFGGVGVCVDASHQSPITD